MSFEANVRAFLRSYQNEYLTAIRSGQHTAELSFRVPMHEMFRSRSSWTSRLESAGQRFFRRLRIY